MNAPKPFGRRALPGSAERAHRNQTPCWLQGVSPKIGGRVKEREGGGKGDREEQNEEMVVGKGRI